MVRVLSSPAPVLPDVSMSQSSLLMASLIGGFVVYLMMNQKLATYWSILMGGSSSGTTPASAGAGSATSSTTSTLPGTAPGNTGASGTLVQPQGPSGLVPGSGLQITPGMQGN